MSGIAERNFEDTIYEYLSQSGMYITRDSNQFDLDKLFDTEMLESFIKTSQPDEWKKLERQFPGAEIESVVFEFNKLKHKRGLLSLIREGFPLQGAKLKFAYFKPSSGFNEDHKKKYEANKFAVIRQFHYSKTYPDKSIDIVILLNGIPIISMELKNEFTGQNVTHAQNQYRKDREAHDPFLKTCLVHFAVDNNTVFMTTKLENGETRFLPFNRDVKNPVIEDKFASSYLWEEILQADSLLDLLQNYIHYEYDDKEQILKTIFPRYHQLDSVRKLLSNAKDNGSGRNYLVQHSAGSGKSNSIAWLAHQLANLHKEDQLVFDSIIIITDRKVLDRQLQNTVKQFEQVKGTVKKIDKNSKQLIEALQNGEKIIISTLQKFGYLEEIAELPGKKFAIIVDEAHSSQTGENVKDLKVALTSEEEIKKAIEQDEENYEPTDTVEDELKRIMKSRQKLPHLSFFAFTATPKPKTLELFGDPAPETKLKYKAFHLYSMRQAIEEGFILDVLQSYTTREVYFELIENEKAEGEKEFEKLKVKKLLITEVSKHPHSINTKSHIMLNHFMEKTIYKIDNKAKGMLVTSSRLHAVLYKQAFDNIIKEEGYPIKTLVAFSGTVEIEGEKFTEQSMNGEKVKDIAETFKKNEYKILIVANKFQTGFDQPLLHTMYVDKKLASVAAVQTLSRINRKYNRKKQDTFILDFVNKQDEIKEAFQDYYQSTILDKGTDKQKLYNQKYEIEKHGVFTNDDVEYFIDMFVNKKVKSEKLSPFFKKLIDDNFEKLSNDNKDKFRKTVKSYVRQYSFISQIITFIDIDLEKFYLFTKLLYKNLPYAKETLPLEVVEMVDMDKFRIDEKENGSILLNPEDSIIENPSGDGHGAKIKVKDHLKEIVKEINEKYAINLTEADKIINGIKEKLIEDESLRASFKADNLDDIKKLKLKESIDQAFLSNVDDYLNFMSKMEEDPGLGRFFTSHLFHWFNHYLKTEESISKEKDVLLFNGYIYLDTKDYEKGEQFYTSLKTVFEINGFEFVDDGAQVKGSWIRKKISFIFRKLSNIVEPEDALKKVKEALELKHIDKVQSEINKNNIEAAAAFVKANETVDNAAAVMGPLLFLKTTKDGIVSTITRMLNKKEMKYLEEHPEECNNPLTLLAGLSRLSE